MIIALRIIIGISLLITYLLIFTGIVDWFPEFYQTQTTIFHNDKNILARAKTGLFFIYCMALASVFLIVYPRESYKVFMGFFLALLTFAVFASF